MSDNLINVMEEDIEINFFLDGEEYVVLKNNNVEDGRVLIGKIISVDDELETIVSVTDEEYQKALDEYVSMLEDELEVIEYEN